ncbi:MAG: hypothetical protein U0X75_25160 [Acidobacteriota bacterium]
MKGPAIGAQRARIVAANPANSASVSPLLAKATSTAAMRASVASSDNNASPIRSRLLRQILPGTSLLRLGKQCINS